METWSDFKQHFYGHLGSNKANDVVDFVLRWEQWTPGELRVEANRQLNMRLWSALTKAVRVGTARFGTFEEFQMDGVGVWKAWTERATGANRENVRDLWKRYSWMHRDNQGGESLTDWLNRVGTAARGLENLGQVIPEEFKISKMLDIGV